MSVAAESPYALSQGRALTHAPLLLSYSAQLGAEPEAVFAYISDFERLPEWMPLIKRCAVDNTGAACAGQVGAVRVIQPLLGSPTLERVVAFEPGLLLAYRASDESLRGLFRDHLAVLTTERHLEGGTLLCWLTFARRGTPPLSWLGRAVFSHVIRTSLNSLQRRFPTPSARR